MEDNRLDTVTLALSTESQIDELVPFGAFAIAIAKFYGLVNALTENIPGKKVEWVVESLEISSAIATVRGIGERDHIERIVRAYVEVGTAIQEHRPIPYPQPVIKAAKELTSILNHRVRTIRFESAEREAIVRSGDGNKIVELSDQIDKMVLHSSISAAPSFGAIEGRIQTLTNRGGLRFTLFDLVNDKAVSCYLKEGHEGQMRDSWGKLAVVIGQITRDPMSGRPLSVRQVTDIVIRPEVTGTYRDARGVSPPLTDLSPEAAIRKIRDAT